MKAEDFVAIATFEGVKAPIVVRYVTRRRQVLMSFLECCAITRKGMKCQYQARYGTFCGIHKL